MIKKEKNKLNYQLLLINQQNDSNQLIEIQYQIEQLYKKSDQLQLSMISREKEIKKAKKQD